MKYSVFRGFVLPFIKLFFLSSLAHATIEHPEPNQPNTGELYRVDNRSYTDIFANGFTSFGRNDNLYEHVRGRSCAGFNANSAFISLTANHDQAMNYLLRQSAHVSSELYVYRIRSSPHTHNMERSLQAAFPDYAPGLNTAREQSEWISYRFIPREDIHSVDVYIRGEHIRTVNNRYYVNRAPYVQTMPYRSNDTVMQSSSRGTTIFEQFAPVVTACFASNLFSCHSSNTRNLSSSLVTKDQCGKSRSIADLLGLYKTQAK